MPIRPETDNLINFLNELLAIDPAWITALVQHRAPCNETLAEHPTVQVGTIDGVPQSGMLGLLNGFCGQLDEGPRAGWGPITAVIQEGRVQHFLHTDTYGLHGGA